MRVQNLHMHIEAPKQKTHCVSQWDRAEKSPREAKRSICTDADSEVLVTVALRKKCWMES